MATKTWNVGNGTWGTSANWSPTGVPISTDDVIINSNVTVTVSATANCRHLSVNGGVSVTLAGTSTLNVNGDLEVANATLTTTGMLVNFTGTAQDGNWTPGSGTYARVTCAKSSRVLNTWGTPSIGTFTFTSGTLNQNYAITVTGSITNNGTTARTWNMNGNDVNIDPGSATCYTGASGTTGCTFQNRGYFTIVQSGKTISQSGGGVNNAPSIRVPWLNTLALNGSVYDLDLNGQLTGANTVTIWNDFIDNASANSTAVTAVMARSTAGTYSYGSYHQWGTLQFGSAGAAVTWDIYNSKANNLTLAGSGFTYNLNDVEVCTNNTTGVLSATCTGSTVNINNIYANQGTSTQLQLTGGTTTYNIAASSYGLSIPGGFSFSGANSTYNLINDFQCRYFTHSGATNKTFNFNNNWLIIENAGPGGAPTTTINSSANLLTDMSTTWTGGLIVRNSYQYSTPDVSLGTMPATHALRVRWEAVSVGSLNGIFTGQVREFIFGDNGQINGSSVVTLVDGNIIFDGTINSQFDVVLGHSYNYTFDHASMYWNQGKRFNNVSVGSMYTGTEVTILAGILTFATAKTGITYNLQELICLRSIDLTSTSCTYNLVNIVTINPGDSVSYAVQLGAGTASTYNLDYVNLYGYLTFTGGTLNIVGNYDISSRRLTISSTTAKTLTTNDKYFVIRDKGYSTGSCSILTASSLTANWGTGGIMFRCTGSVDLGTGYTAISNMPRAVIAMPDESSVTTRYAPDTFIGSVQLLHHDNAGTGLNGSSTLTSDILYVYGNITGNTNAASGHLRIDFKTNSTVSATTTEGWFRANTITLNTSGIVVDFNTGFRCTLFTQAQGQANIGANSTVTVADLAAIPVGIAHTGGTFQIAANATVFTYNYTRTGTNSCSLILNGNMECPQTTGIGTRWSCADTTNYTVTGDGWIIYRGAGQFNYGQTNSSAINYTTGANTFNVKILNNISSTTTGFLYLSAAKTFTNHEGTFDQMGRWAANTAAFNMHIFGDFSVYAPPNDNGTYRNKLALIRPVFAGTDSSKIHNFGNTSINPGYGGMEPSFSGIRMASAGTLKCLHNVNCSGTVFQHSAGTVELTSSNINCTTVWLGSVDGNSALDSGTRTWIFPAANTHIVCSSNFVHSTTTGLQCSGTYYNSTDPTQLSGVYINSSSTTPVDSGSVASTSTPPNFIIPNTITKLASPFYCNGISLKSDNVIADGSVYVRGMWAPSSQTGTNAAWLSGINVYMIGTSDGYIDTTGDTASCPITIVDPGVGNTKIVYTSARTSQTTRIGTITVNTRTTLSGNPIPANSASNVVISGLLTLLGSLVIKSGQGWDFSGSGLVLDAGTAQNITDAGGIIYFSNSAAVQAIFPTTTINNITRNTTSSNSLTLTSNNTTISNIVNDASGGGSFVFVDGGSGAIKFVNFNIDGKPSALTSISGPVISTGNTFTVDYAGIINSTANPVDTWYGGIGTVDLGGNTNWNFLPSVNNSDNFFLVLF